MQQARTPILTSREAEIKALLSGPGYVDCPICNGRIPRSTCTARIRKAYAWHGRDERKNDYILKSNGPDYSPCLSCPQRGRNGNS